MNEQTVSEQNDIENPVDHLYEFYDQVRRNLWAGGNILRSELPRVPIADSLPTASADWRHRIVVIPGGAGVADVIYLCIKNDADTYEWQAIGALTESSSTTDLKDAMVAAGIIADGGATPLNLDGGDLTVDDITADVAGIATLNVSGNTVMTQDLTVRNINMTGTLLGFYNSGTHTKPTVTGSRGGNAALASLLTALSGLGLLTDSSS